MSEDRILLVSGTAPGDRSVGALYLRDLCATLPDGILATHIAGSPESADAEAIAQAAYRHRATLLWFVLDVPWLYAAAADVAHTVRTPLITTVWDPPERVAREAGAGESVAMHDFARAMRASSACGVVCEPMAIEYRSRYGVDAIVVRQGIPAERCLAPADGPSDGGALRIAFAGSVYSHEPWHALADALESIDWQVAGRRVKLDIYGDEVPPVCQVGDHLELHGWMSSDELIAQLAPADICYMPSWFDRDHHIAARLSFPTKLTTYLATGRATLVHALAQSAPAAFARAHDCALVCDTLGPAHIAQSLLALAQDRGRYAELTGNAAAVVAGELSMDTFTARFSELLAKGRASARQRVAAGGAHG